MGKTCTSLTYHLIFSTKYRRRLILPALRPELFNYVGGILRDNAGTCLEIGGVEDHVHIMAGIPSKMAVSDMLRLIKTNSSKWLNETKKLSSKFAWQPGFGAFTVSYSQQDSLRRYIQSQEEHHRRKSFQEEFLALLDAHQISYETKYVFEEEHVG